MAKAIWNEVVVAESDDVVEVENRLYFPHESVKMEYLKANGRTYHCAWKGEADYYDVIVGDKVCEDGSWSYPRPSEAARKIAGRFGFWRGVQVVR
jgi:uncharacterized protein (DUF427 family)